MADRMGFRPMSTFPKEKESKTWPESGRTGCVWLDTTHGPYLLHTPDPADPVQVELAAGVHFWVFGAFTHPDGYMGSNPYTGKWNFYGDTAADAIAKCEAALRRIVIKPDAPEGSAAGTT